MNNICGHIEGYVTNIKQFVDGEISASQFEESYSNIFKNHENLLPENVFEILNELFLDIDAYCSDPELMEEDDIDDQELMRRAELALERLS